MRRHLENIGRRRMSAAGAFLAALLASAGSGAGQDLAFKGGTVLTVTRGVVEDGTVLILNGKIAAVGRGITIPDGVEVVDIKGMYVMPGIVDSHSHVGFVMDDINEQSGPVTPQVWMREALDPDHDSILRALAGGVTTVKTMHGSLNVIGGVNVTMKLKYGSPVEDMIVPGVRQQIKLALGENPMRFYGPKGVSPSTRMGNAYVMRKAFLEAREYIRAWDRWEKDRAAGRREAREPRRDLAMETLRMVLEKKIAADCHVYRADEIVWIIDFCREFGIDLKQLSHGVNAYKVADVIGAAGIVVGGSVDWWGYKDEAYDGCPYGIQSLRDAGVAFAVASDSWDEDRYLNLNAAKVLKYTEIPVDEVLKMITLNPARALEMEGRVGSLEPGKDGDLAVFDKHPLDATGKCVLTVIEGVRYFDIRKDGSAGKEEGHA